MDESVEVVEEIRVDAATDAAAQVGQVAAIGDAAIVAEVSAVGDALEEHAELSEERHGEILEDTSWLRTQLENLSILSTTLTAQLQAFQSLVIAELATLKMEIQRMTPNPNASPDMPVSIPPETPVEPLPVVEPPAGDARPVPETPPEKRSRYRKI
jgi:hypothetical protein